MSEVIINPGTGPVLGTERTAWRLMGEFAADLVDMGLDIYQIEHQTQHDDGEGRFRFEVYARKGRVERSFDIDMPGVEAAAKGEPWVSPRLYVDGSSWLWGYALGIVESKFEDDTE